MPDRKPDNGLDPSTQLYHANSVLESLKQKRKAHGFLAPILFLLSVLSMLIATCDSVPTRVPEILIVLSLWLGYMCWDYAKKSTVTEFEEFAENDVERLTNMIEICTDRQEAMHGLTVAEDAEKEDGGLSMDVETSED